ncbi:MAG: CBS domain-containing protein [Parvularculaceae bacterium]
MLVGEILTSKGGDIFEVAAEDTVAQAVAILADKNIGAVLVRDQKKTISGILSERDVVRHLAKGGNDPLQTPVADLMTKNVVTCEPNMTVDALMAVMSERRIRHIPVVQNGNLKGMISIGDVVKRKISQSEEEAEALRQYIAAS